MIKNKTPHINIIFETYFKEDRLKIFPDFKQTFVVWNIKEQFSKCFVEFFLKTIKKYDQKLLGSML